MCLNAFLREPPVKQTLTVFLDDLLLAMLYLFKYFLDESALLQTFNINSNVTLSEKVV